MPTATPTPSRHRSSTTHEPPAENDNDIPQLDDQLPPYEPPLAPLTPSSQNALANLVQSYKLKNLQTHIQHAVEKLGDSAAQVNERLTDARERYTRYMSKKRSRDQYENDNDGEGEEEDGEILRFKRTEEQVHSITEKLDAEMRGIVDTEVKAGGLITILTDLGKEAEVASIQRPSRKPGRRRHRDPDPDNSDEDAEDDDEYQETQQTQSQTETEPPSQKLTHQLASDADHWHALSLTQRYSTNNTYIGFYRMVHDAKHPGDDIPPLPHASTWFRHLEDPSTVNTTAPTTSTAETTGAARQRTRRRKSSPAKNTAEEEEDDIAIERERISLKCPLTLLTFQEPLTSTKCPHSFEAQAILDMISTSPTTVPVPGGDRRNRVRAVKCPVCSVELTEQDLKRDPVLVRRVKRMEAMQRQDEDDEDDEDDEGGDDTRRKRSRGQRKSGITVASDDESGEDEDDEEEEEQPVRIKQEKAMSRGPSTA